MCRERSGHEKLGVVPDAGVLRSHDASPAKFAQDRPVHRSPGHCRLRSTGEMVIDQVNITMWTVPIS